MDGCTNRPQLPPVAALARSSVNSRNIHHAIEMFFGLDIPGHDFQRILINRGIGSTDPVALFQGLHCRGKECKTSICQF